MSNEVAEWYSDIPSWRLWLAVVIVLIALSFRLEIVRFIVTILQRFLFKSAKWIKEFDKHLSNPLSWLFFVLLLWLAVNLLQWDSEAVNAIFIVVLGVPIIWLIIGCFDFVTVVIIWYYGWKRLRSKDDNSRIVIVSEGLGVVKYFLCAIVVFIVYVNRLDQDTRQLVLISLVALELAILLGSYTSVKNTIAGLVLIVEEPLVTGCSIKIENNEGVVEAINLKNIVLRRTDKATAYVPNGLLLDTGFSVQNLVALDKIEIHIALGHNTSSSKIRQVIQEIDAFTQSYDITQLNEDGVRTNRAVSTIVNFKKNVLEKNSTTPIEDKIPRFWIAIDKPFDLTLVYFTNEQDMGKFALLKSNLILHITEILQNLEVDLYSETVDYDITYEPPVRNSVFRSEPVPSSESEWDLESNMNRSLGPRNRRPRRNEV